MGALALSPEDQGIDEIGESYVVQRVVVDPWMSDENIRWLDLYHICEMLGLIILTTTRCDEDCETATSSTGSSCGSSGSSLQLCHSSIQSRPRSCWSSSIQSLRRRRSP